MNQIILLHTVQYYLIFFSFFHFIFITEENLGMLKEKPRVFTKPEEVPNVDKFAGYKFTMNNNARIHVELI